MTKLVVGKDRISITESERYVSGTEGAYRANVTFSKDWECLDRSLFFRAMIDNNPCNEVYAKVVIPAMSMSFKIPDKVFAVPAQKLQVTAAGSRKGKSIKVLGTPWTSLGRVIQGADLSCPDDPTNDPTSLLPSGGLKDQVLAKASDDDYDFYWMSIQNLPISSGVTNAPINGICMYAGTIDSIPEGWSICDGQNGTLDLRNAFVLGASDEAPPHTTGEFLPLTPDTPILAGVDDTIDSDFGQDAPVSRYYSLLFIQKTSGSSDEVSGKSAYDYAVEAGYTGTEQDFSEAMRNVAEVPIKRSLRISSKQDIPVEGAGSYIFVDVSVHTSATRETPITFNRDFVYLDDSDPAKLRLTTLQNNIYDCHYNPDGNIASIERVTASTGSGEKGDPGDSAYQVAVKQGFAGTEEEWLKSLEGDPGASAYEVAVKEGFIGTKEEWLASLKASNDLIVIKDVYPITNISQFSDVGIDVGLISNVHRTIHMVNSGFQGLKLTNEIVEIKKVYNVAKAEIIRIDGVKTTFEFNTTTGEITSTSNTDISSDGGKGDPGDSAYQVAVNNGFTGTEQEWLKSLEGKSAYELAVGLGYTGTLEQWLNSLKGENGLSAYEVAQRDGYQGTEEDWLVSLKGQNGSSAYELAVEQGFEGTLEEWLESLNGVGNNEIDEIKTSLATKQDILNFGYGINKTENTVTLDNPVRGIMTQAEYDALTEEQRAKGTYFVDDGQNESISGGSAGEVYDEQERVIGSWFGDPLYRCCFSVTSPSNTNNAVILPFSGRHVVSISGFLETANGPRSVNFPNDSSNFIVTFQTGSGDIMMKAMNSSYQKCPVNLVLEYTKTADTEVTT